MIFKVFYQENPDEVPVREKQKRYILKRNRNGKYAKNCKDAP